MEDKLAIEQTLENHKRIQYIQDLKGDQIMRKIQEEMERERKKKEEEERALREAEKVLGC